MKKQPVVLFAAAVAAVALLLVSCKPAAKSESSSGSTKATASITPPVTAKITFSDLLVPPKPAMTPRLIEQGKAVYLQNCTACHGVNGDGQGAAAAFLMPPPRDFVKANYRMRSTATSRLPTDVDLFRAVSLGMSGTPMPAWKFLLSEDDRWAVVEYLKTLSSRFADPSEVRTVVSLGTPPPRSESVVAEGKALYTKLACITCHGETGRGDGTAAVNLVDESQTKIKPRDLSNPGLFKSGYATKEIVRTILTGFNGTPMVGFHGTIPESDAWKVAYFVETLAKPAPPGALVRASQNFLVREQLGEPDVRFRLTERAWTYDSDTLRVKKGQIVEITFEPSDNGLGVGHGFAISGYDEAVFLNGVMVGVPKTVKFRADRAGKFIFYCSTQCSTEKLHPLMNGTFIVEDNVPKQTASLE